MSTSHPLIEVAEHVARNSKVAVIFDLDSTLFCVSPRTQAILRALADDEKFRALHEAEAEVLRDIQVLPTDWGVRQALERREKNPTPEAGLKIRDYWHANFFSNAFLDKDTIYPAANEYARHLASLGAEILYLTGRGELTMREGTEKGLARWQFPPGRLIMKPSDVVTDESFKALVIKDLAPNYEHIWLFENEPVIIEHVRRETPQVRVVFMRSVHAGRAEPPKDVPHIEMSYLEGLPRK